VSEWIVVDQEKCHGCGLCVSVCACGALSLKNGVVVIDSSLQCGWCTLCEAVCAYGAIRCPFEIVVEETGP
jgi:Fe-S-cluster-containing hydrogenase component 2